MADSVGRVIGDRYQIVGELGRGGMGVVYLGRDLWRDMSVAIKLCGREDAHAMLWFKREFRVVASLRHPNLVELFELVAHERSYYFTMEHVAGVDPRRWTRSEAARTDESETSTLAPLRPPPATSGGPGPPVEIDFARVRAVLAQLAEGLAFLHGRGVIHRDIKPSNVLVADGTVKLLDFGLALDRQRIDGERARERDRLVGTPAYMAPEYLGQKIVSPAMDIFSLGVLACELVTGVSPLQGIDLGARSDVPPDLESLILSMIDSNPARRPTALEIATSLHGSMALPRASRRVERFVGRTAEIQRITRVVADESPRARVVVVRGPSGVGKTALVDEAIGRARIAGVLPELGWRGRCHERELVPYRAFDFIIDDLAAELIRAPELAATIEHAGALRRGFPSLAPALSAAAVDDAAGDLRVERERALIAMTRLFDLAIDEQRAVVTIDDLQWADDDSIELLAVIVARVARALTIVATWSETSSTSVDRLSEIVDRLGAAVDVISLAPLGNVELAEIVAAAAPAAPIEDVRAAIAIADGSPYLAELIARELAETGTVERSGAEARLLARLSRDERSLVELTAISLSGTTFEQLRALADLPSGRLTTLLRSLEDARVLGIAPSAKGEPIYTCYHQRLRDAASAAIAKDALRELHLRVAEHAERHDGEPEQLAHHYEHAGDPRAARWAIVAADDARARLAWAVASDWYERAIALGETQCRQQLAECLFLGGKLAEAARTYEQLADSAPDGGEKWRVRAAESCIKLGELERGLAILDGVLERRGEPRARGRIASSARTLGVMARWLSPLRGRAAAPADEVLAAAYRVIASFLSTPYPIEAFEYVVRSVAIADRTGDRDNHATGMAMLSVYIAISSLGRFGDRAIAIAAQSGAPYPRMVAAGATGILATIRGDWEAMRRSHGEGHRICMKLGLQKSWEASFLRTYEALGEYFAGEPARAITILDELAETSDDLFARALIGSYRARALLLDGRIDAARAAEHDIAHARVAKRGLPEIYRQLFAAELALADGDWLRAEALGHALARHARAEWIGALPAVAAMIDILIATAEIGRGDRASAQRAHARARRLERWARVSFHAASALRLRAQAELRLGNTAEAHRVLDRAAAAAARSGSKLDRLAIERLRGNAVDLGSLALAVRWSTGGIVY